MTSAIMALQGFNLTTGFLTKELTVMTPNRNFAHWLFLKPKDRALSNTDELTVKYSSEKLHQLQYTDGNVSYTELDRILKELAKFDKIYTYGHVAAEFLSKNLPSTKVIDTMDIGCSLPKDSKDKTDCGRKHNARYCSLWAAFKMYSFLNE